MVPSSTNQPGDIKMNKSEQREVTKAVAYSQQLAECSPIMGKDYLARALSIIIRSSLKASTKREILGIALEYHVIDSSEFIV